ncbi:MAG: hypothetical protein ACJAVV_003313 [Alphaproteobacteria bacterium]|jgi:hypothetical protein
MFFRKFAEPAYAKLFSSNLLRLLILLVLFCLFGKQASADESDYSLNVKPQECVSLYQGQSCYLTLNFVFSAPFAGNYCLYIKGNIEPLQCVSGERQGTFSLEFDTDKNVSFELRNSDEVGDTKNKVLAQAKLTLSWVYKVPNKKRLAWRLF